MATINSSAGRDSFGADPSAYSGARPPYPPELFGWLASSCSLGSRTASFEIGAGAGHATLPVLDLGVGSLLAIEPDAALAGFLQARSADPRLEVSVERFETCTLRDGAFDFGFAATSFHWLPRGKALAKVRSALRPGGWFAMWWHVFHDPAQPDRFDHAAAHLFDGLEQAPKGGRPPVAFARDAKARMGELRAAGFSAVQHREFVQAIEFSPDQLCALYATFSRVARAPADRRDRLLAEVRRIAAEDFGGAVRRDVACSAFITRKP